MRKSFVLAFTFIAMTFASSTISSTARAQQPNKAEAMKHFDTGQAAYEKKDYPAAVKEFLSAYSIAPVNSLLFNIGQAYRLSGDSEKALAYYAKYVEFEPNGPQVPEAKQHIKELKENVATAENEQKLKDEEAARAKADAEAKLAADTQSKAALEARQKEEAMNKGSGLRTGGVVLGIAGLVAAGAGVAVAAGGSTGAGAGIAVGGGALIVTGTILYLIGKGQQKDALANVGKQTSMIVPTVAPGYAGAAWVGSF